MRSRWLMVFSLFLLTWSTYAFAVRRADLPSSGGGVLNDCGSPHSSTGGNNGLYFSTSPVVQLTPMTVKDTSGTSYTVHVDVYDWGNLACLYPPFTSSTSELRTYGDHSLFVVYVIGPDGTTQSPVALKSFQIAKPLTNPDFNICMGGWHYCNTAIDGPQQSQAALLQPAASAGAEGTNTVWNFGLGYDLGEAGGGPTTAIPLNSNMDTTPHGYGGVPYGYGILIADGTVTCDTPAQGPCNSLVASTPYRLTFVSPTSSTPVTATSIAPRALTSAAGHDSPANPIVISGGTFQGFYDASGNYPALTNGLPTNNDGSSATAVTFSCSSVSGSRIQQFRSVYFKWTAPANTPVYLTTAGGHYDTILTVTGGSVNTCNDDYDPTSSSYPNGIGRVTSALSFQAVAGTTYQFLVTEYPPAPTPLGSIFFPNTQQDVYIGPLSSDAALYLTLSTPQLGPVPSALNNFGSVAVGMTSPAQTLTLRSNTSNFGSTGITNVTASASGDFQVTPTSCATPLADSSSCVLSVTFKPTASGTRTGTLTISSSGASPAEDTPFGLALSGTGAGGGAAGVTTTGGINGYVPVFTGASTVVDSILQQYNGGIGIGRAPAATLDVNGKSIFRGGMDMSRLGDATTTAGATSSPLQMQSSVYNSNSKTNLLPYFQLETEPVGNNTATTGASLNFLYFSGVGAAPVETGLYINPNGTIHFAAGQTFPTTPAAVPVAAAMATLRGEPGPAGPTGPSGTAGPNLAVVGTVAANRGFVSESSDSTVSQFLGSNSAEDATVMALNSTGKGSYGLLARSAYVGIFAQGTQYAARFNGAVTTDSNLSSAGSSFKIDHPLDPEKESLSHSTVSSPEMINIYNGIIVTDASGNATVTMPKYFEALNSDFQYQLTVIGQFSKALVASGIVNGTFTIRTEKPNVKVSWQVTGVRQDAWANAHRVQAEMSSSEIEKPRLIRPVHTGASKDVNFVEPPGLRHEP